MAVRGRDYKVYNSRQQWLKRSNFGGRMAPEMREFSSRELASEQRSQTEVELRVNAKQQRNRHSCRGQPFAEEVPETEHAVAGVL